MAQVNIPQKFFLEEAKKEYSGALSQRLFQEVFQNSRDAGATIIYLTFDDKGYSIKDNGIGMDKDTLLKGLLSLGGSVKTENATGAFGAAKKLVLFSHKNYKIRTRNFLAVGEVLEYELSENEPFFDGTEIVCEFFDDFDSSCLDYYAKSILKKCDFNNSCKVFINNEEFTEWMDWSNDDKVKIIDTDWCVLKSKPGNGYATIRKNGIYSFYRYTNCKKDAIIELKPPSSEVFTQNRDGLRPPYSNKLDAICSEMSKGESTFGVSGIREFVFVGRNRFLEFVNKVKESSEDAKVVINLFGDISESKSVYERKALLDALSAFCPSSIDQKQLKEINEEICNEIEYDFVIDLGGSKYTRPPDEYRPNLMSKRLSFLAKLWKTSILKILEFSNNSLDFKIGFTFDSSAAALYSKGSNNVVKLLINPEKFDFSKSYQERFWSVFVCAIEEVSHAIAFKDFYVRGHNEEFNSVKNSILEKVLPEVSWRSIWKQSQSATL